MEPLRAPIDQALADQIDRLERVATRGLRALAVFGVIFGIVIGVTLSRRLGFACAATSAALAIWFTVLLRLLDRGAVGAGLRAVGVAVESAIPWAFLAVIALREGAVYALASWLPPMLFCALILAHSVRLRPGSCALIGVIGAASYLAIYALVVYVRLPSDAPRLLLTQPPMQLGRAGSLLFAGALGAVLARAMRGAISRAEQVVRSQDLFGKYRLVRKISAGGMGVVFEARYCPEGGFERRVAVKRIHPHLAADPTFVKAFRDEAELGARLAHPNVVQVLDFGSVADSYFLAMEFVDGMTLSALTHRCTKQQRSLPPPLVAHLLREILSALAYAHEGARGDDGRPLRVVHRDLCPPNVLVSKNGEVKVTDFGIARSLHDLAVATTRNVTGHVGYMAPEQARAEVFDTRADLFPVGAIAWELLSLRPLFKRDTEASSLLALLDGKVPPIEVLRPDLDPRWTTWIDRATARDPEHRFPSAQAMREALDAIDGTRDAHASEELGTLVEELSEARDRARSVDAEETPTVAQAQRSQPNPTD
ncbi:MAG: serine/threonine-protein kinase [Polyangiales bacterium]